MSIPLLRFPAGEARTTRACRQAGEEASPDHGDFARPEHRRPEAAAPPGGRRGRTPRRRPPDRQHRLRVAIASLALASGGQGLACCCVELDVPGRPCFPRGWLTDDVSGDQQDVSGRKLSSHARAI